MADKKIWKLFLILIAGATSFILLSCDVEKNINASNLVTIDGHVFFSRTKRVGVPGITVVIEKSTESSTMAVIPDIFVRTDENGRWEAKFTLSYPDGGGVMDITPQYVEESIRILMVSPETRMLDLGSGFTLQVGKTYHIWDVFLEDFVEMELQ